MSALYSFTLRAGVETQVSVQGKLILIDEVTAPLGVDVMVMLNGSTSRTMPGRKKAFKCWVNYDALVLKAAVDCRVALFLGADDVSLGFADGALVNVVGGVTVDNGRDRAIPVDIAGGNVNVTATNIGVNNDDAHPVPVRNQALSTLVNLAPVLVSADAARLLVNDAAMRRLVITNVSETGAVAIGGQGVTMDNAAIIIAPGDLWIEESAAGAAWYAVSNQDNTEVRILGSKQ
jgi:hypothetical protein